LHCASYWGKVDVVNLLLEMGANDSLTDDVSLFIVLLILISVSKDDETPLAAATRNNQSICIYFLEKFAQEKNVRSLMAELGSRLQTE
jgi:ankyrin repeat protein